MRFLLDTLGTGQMLHLVGGVMDVLIRLTFNLTKRNKRTQILSTCDKLHTLRTLQIRTVNIDVC